MAEVMAVENVGAVGKEKGKGADAWRGARETLGDRISEKNKVARKQVR